MDGANEASLTGAGLQSYLFHPYGATLAGVDELVTV